MNFLASPPLVVAYSLVGTMNINLANDPIGKDNNDNDVYLKDIWPSQSEVSSALSSSINSEMFASSYKSVFDGDDNWNSLDIATGEKFAWDINSTYIKHPPYFENMKQEPAGVMDIKNARLLALLGDSVTTDHISPAGAIAKGSPASKYLIDQGVDENNFNSYGSRRGNHEVMMRGTFANIRLRNKMAPGTEEDGRHITPVTK